MYLLESGQFVTAMPKSIASQSPIKIFPVELPVRPWPLAIFTLKNGTVSPVVDRLMVHLRDFVRSIPANSAPRSLRVRVSAVSKSGDDAL
jgi:hypothetical protein